MLRFRAAATILLGLGTLAGTVHQAAAQDRRVPASPAELRLSYAPIVQRVQPAVVNVYAAKMVQNHNPFMDDPIFRRFFGVPGGQQEQLQRSLGSGVMVDPSGLVVTNVHVIEGADQVKVSLSDKREFEAEIVLKDSRSDLAVLRLKDTHEKFRSPASTPRSIRAPAVRRASALRSLPTWCASSWPPPRAAARR